MSNDYKIVQLKCLLEAKEIENYYRTLDIIGDLKTNYGYYLITEPINCDVELKKSGDG